MSERAKTIDTLLDERRTFAPSPEFLSKARVTDQSLFEAAAADPEAFWAEPINPEAWMWYREHIGGDRIPVVDTWWQTETGGIMIAPLPGVTVLKPGSATKPLPGVGAAVVDESGEPGRAWRRRLRHADEAVAGDAARHLGRRRAL